MIEQIIEKYKTLKNYTDQGFVYQETTKNGKESTRHIEFNTLFNRAGDFRFDFKYKLAKPSASLGGMVYQKAEEEEAYLRIEQSALAPTNTKVALNFGIAALTGLSGKAVTMISPLLLGPFDNSNNIFTGGRKLLSSNNIHFNGANCIKLIISSQSQSQIKLPEKLEISKELKDKFPLLKDAKMPSELSGKLVDYEEELTYWVRETDNLIVKIESISKVNQMKIHTIACIYPQAEKELSSADFEKGLPKEMNISL